MNTRTHTHFHSSFAFQPATGGWEVVVQGTGLGGCVREKEVKNGVFHGKKNVCSLLEVDSPKHLLKRHIMYFKERGNAGGKGGSLKGEKKNKNRSSCALLLFLSWVKTGGKLKANANTADTLIGIRTFRVSTAKRRPTITTTVEVTILRWKMGFPLMRWSLLKLFRSLCPFGWF